jgi:hypothetical protein
MATELSVQRRSDKLLLYDPDAADLAAADASRMRIACTDEDVTIEAPALYFTDPLLLDTGNGKEQLGTVVNELRQADAIQASLIASNHVSHASLENTVNHNKEEIENALAEESAQRALSDAELAAVAAANRTAIEAALTAEAAARSAAVDLATAARTTMEQELRAEHQSVFATINATVTQLQTEFTAEKNSTITSRNQMQTNIDTLQANLDQVVGGGLDAQKLQDIKEFVAYVNASDGQTALLLKLLCDYVRQLKISIGAGNGSTNLPIMDKMLQAEANRNLSDAQLAELLMIAGQHVYLYSKSMTGTNDTDYVETQDYSFHGMSGFAPISAAGGVLAAVHAIYQTNTSLLDCDRALVRIKSPLRLQTNDFFLENLTCDTSEFADSPAGATFRTVLALYGNGLVNNLTIKSCVFIGTLDVNAARFAEWMYIGGPWLEGGGYAESACTGNILIEDCCFKNSGGPGSIRISGPEAPFGTLSSVTIKNCHFTNTSGAVMIKGYPLSKQQNAVGNVLIENVTFEHAPHTKSYQGTQNVFEIYGVLNLTMRNILVKNAEGNLFRATNAVDHYNLVRCWSRARVNANRNNDLLQVNWTFDNVAVENSSFASAFFLNCHDNSFACPLQGQAQVGLHFQNFTENAFAGCEAVVSHLNPAKPDGVYSALTPSGVQITTPPSYDNEFAHVLTDSFGATRKQMSIGP